MLPGERGLGIGGVGIVEGGRVGFAAGDGGAAQVFDGLVEGQPSLLAQDLAQQNAEGTHVAAQRSFLQIAGGGLKLSQSLLPVGWGPKRGHRLLCTGGGMEEAGPTHAAIKLPRRWGTQDFISRVGQSPQCGSL